MDSQNPPELEAPFLESGEEKEAKVVDPGMQDLQTNIF
jgi:non-specific serine/threonine protein kinase